MENKRKNTIITILLMLFIIFIIVGSFILSTNPFNITWEILVCMALLVVLCLADSFDNLSIPKLISLSKNMKEMKEDNERLKSTNIKLVEQITSIRNSNNQIMYIPGTFNTVGSTNIEDISSKSIEENENNTNDNENITNKSLSEQRKLQAERHKYIKNLDVFLLKKAIINDDNSSEIQYDVKVTNNKSTENSITKDEARFDALKFDNKNNIFYEVKKTPFFIDFYYQLYYKLKVVEMYGKTNNTMSKLLLIIPDVDVKLSEFIGDNRRFELLKERIYDRFEPAINMGLLEIRQIKVSKDELDIYINKKDND